MHDHDCTCCRLIPGPYRPTEEDLKRREVEASREAERLISEITATMFVSFEDYERILYGTQPLSSANDESYGMGC